MKLIKQLIATAACSLLLSVGANAAVVATNIVNANVLTTTNCIITNNLVLQSVTLLSDRATTFRFYDNNDDGITNVTSAYTNRASVLTNIVTEVVTTTGITNLYTNTVLQTVPQTVAAATNDLPVVFAVAVGANIPVTLPVNKIFTKGITVVPVTLATNYTASVLGIYERNGSIGGFTDNTP